MYGWLIYHILSPPPPRVAPEGQLRRVQMLGAATTKSTSLAVPPPERATGTTRAAHKEGGGGVLPSFLPNPCFSRQIWRSSSHLARGFYQALVVESSGVHRALEVEALLP
jgi:hypothetical protein